MRPRDEERDEGRHELRGVWLPGAGRTALHPSDHSNLAVFEYDRGLAGVYLTYRLKR